MQWFRRGQGPLFRPGRFVEKLGLASAVLNAPTKMMKAIVTPRARLALSSAPRAFATAASKITEADVLDCQAKWATAIKTISATYLEKGDYVKAAGEAAAKASSPQRDPAHGAVQTHCPASHAPLRLQSSSDVHGPANGGAGGAGEGGLGSWLISLVNAGTRTCVARNS